MTFGVLHDEEINHLLTYCTRHWNSRFYSSIFSEIVRTDMRQSHFITKSVIRRASDIIVLFLETGAVWPHCHFCHWQMNP